MLAFRFPNAIATAASLVAATAGFAAPVDQAPAVTVRYGDLDLTSQAGKVELHHRLARAATSVCPAANPMELATIGIARTCKAKALAGVRAQAETAIATAETRRHYASATPAAGPAGL